MALPVLLPTTVGTARAASHWALQIDTTSSTTLGAGTWTTPFGMTTFTPSKTDNAVDITDFDTGATGFSAKQLFLSDQGVSGTFSRKTYGGATALDPMQEFLRLANFNKQQVHFRYFDRAGSAEAFEGWGFVTWSPKGGTPNDPDTVDFTIVGNGALVIISNPVAVNSAPVLGSATPTTSVATGALVRILGSLLTGATQVKFGTTNATAFDIISDNLIEAIVPATSTGSQPITVINGTGTSNALAFTHA